eukprot:TRINITY_DN7148_c0_g1_i2.p1 TRINITY_DN7148_c0_g1~~TRINITY_DN7148_c0_g1_i2.p1  ORF type:complete len:233 (-),score=31.42 TRINITY_DN7148_c0_g1_i2:114-812(-)
MSSISSCLFNCITSSSSFSHTILSKQSKPILQPRNLFKFRAPNACHCSGIYHVSSRIPFWVLKKRRSENGIRGIHYRLVRASPNSQFPGGGFEDEEDGEEETYPVVLSLAVAGGLACLAFTGNLGWVFDALYTVSVLAVLLPLMGLGALLWYAGRDLLISNCPSCGNEIPVFESALKEGPQLCPYCNKPFTLESKESAWNPFKDFRNPRHESSTEEPSEMVVDVEAEVIDKD